MRRTRDERRSREGFALALLALLWTGHAAASVTGACKVSMPPSGAYTWPHGKLIRHYGLLVPSPVEPGRPLRMIVAFHGWGGDESEFLSDPTVIAESSRRGYLLVAPRGLGAGPPDERNNSWTFRGSASGVVADRGESLPICDSAMTPDYRYPSCRDGRA